MSPGDRRSTGEQIPVLACWTALHLFVLSCPLGCQRLPPSASESPSATRDASRSAPHDESSSPYALTVEFQEATTSSPADEPAEVRQTPAAPISGQDLFALHCAACHGEQGDGQGLAAPYLFPKPRDLRTGQFRLVSTANNVPTRDDLHAVLLRGMPGSSMPPWRRLPQAERDALVDEVLRLRALGARESYTTYLQEEEELTDDEIAEQEVQEEIADYALRFTMPGESRSVPQIPAPDDASIARGRDIYFKQACFSCHGKEGRGDGVEKMVNADGLPTTPRDFTLGIFKGGHDPTSLFRRVAYGMPGTPMPASSSLNPEEVVDLVHYIRSLSSEADRESAILNREVILAKMVQTIPATPDAHAWSDLAVVHLRVTPLWWRNGANPGLQVQAVHDGREIALRMTWSDDSQDDRATQSESFEDAVAIELYRGDREPFLGMGSPSHPVDVWFWDADRQTKADLEDQYANAVADVYPFSERAAETAEYRRPGTSTAEQPEVSLPAVASRNPIVPGQSATGASDLAGGGPGTVTFRIPKNPLVTAEGRYRDGRWAVVMRRTLQVAAPGEGVSLSPGDTASVAFALWNGSQKDRDGQKQISIWQDLELENSLSAAASE